MAENRMSQCAFWYLFSKLLCYKTHRFLGTNHSRSSDVCEDPFWRNSIHKIRKFLELLGTFSQNVSLYLFVRYSLCSKCTIQKQRCIGQCGLEFYIGSLKIYTWGNHYTWWSPTDINFDDSLNHKFWRHLHSLFLNWDSLFWAHLRVISRTCVILYTWVVCTWVDILIACSFVSVIIPIP